VRYVDREGREHREKVGSKSAAQEVYRQRKTEIRLHKFDPEGVLRRRVLTVKGLVERYLPEIEMKRSGREDVRHAGRWVEFMGDVPCDQVQPEDVQRWVRKRLREKTNRGGQVTPATVNRSLACLKRLFNLGIRDGLVERNPVSRVKMLQENNARIRYLLPEEEVQLRAVMSPRDWAAVCFAMNTGLRLGEMVGLRREDLDVRLGMVTVRRSKHGEARHVPMNQSAREALAVILGGHDSDWVFPAPRGGGPRRGDSLSRCVLQPALRRTGIRNFRWHDLRHTFCSRLVMAGVDLRTVQELAGHKTITVTTRYAHLSPGHQRAAVMALDAVVGGDVVGEDAVGNVVSLDQHRKAVG